MAIPHAASGQIVDVRAFGADLSSHRTSALFKTNTLEVTLGFVGRKVDAATQSCGGTRAPMPGGLGPTDDGGRKNSEACEVRR